jgi:hypothetical protein
MRLLTLPVTLARIPVELGVDVARRVGGTAVGAARLAYGVVAGPDEPPAPVRRPEPAPSGNGRAREAQTAVLEPDAVADAQAAVAQAEARVVETEAAPAEPGHVSEEPELVAEVAEQGAEEGAGPEIRLEEPWPGYDGMTAADIVDRLVAEGDAVAAAVSLYEAGGKGRSTVLDAASRSMRG